MTNLLRLQFRRAIKNKRLVMETICRQADRTYKYRIVISVQGRNGHTLFDSGLVLNREEKVELQEMYRTSIGTQS